MLHISYLMDSGEALFEFNMNQLSQAPACSVRVACEACSLRSLRLGGPFSFFKGASESEQIMISPALYPKAKGLIIIIKTNVKNHSAPTLLLELHFKIHIGISTLLLGMSYIHTYFM